MVRNALDVAKKPRRELYGAGPIEKLSIWKLILFYYNLAL
jgi:hypothetical protein